SLHASLRPSASDRRRPGRDAAFLPGDKAARRKKPRELARNPLKMLISVERIQGIPRKSNLRNPQIRGAGVSLRAGLRKSKCLAPRASRRPALWPPWIQSSPAPVDRRSPWRPADGRKVRRGDRGTYRSPFHLRGLIAAAADSAAARLTALQPSWRSVPRLAPAASLTAFAPRCARTRIPPDAAFPAKSRAPWGLPSSRP